MNCITFSFSQPTDSLQVEYVLRGTRHRLHLIKNQEGIVVRLSQIWINGIAACHLRKLKSTRLPQEFAINGKHTKEGDIYHLDFEGKWEWLAKGIRLIRLKCQWRDQTFTADLISQCKIIALKRKIEQTVGVLSEGRSYLLYCNLNPLQEGKSLAEYGITEEDVITVITPSDLIPGHSSRQMATGGNHASITEFEHYYNRMQQIISIVCQIKIPESSTRSLYGTGFLIGDRLIMTNNHVVRLGLMNAQALFFSNTEHPVFCCAIDSIVCSSPTPQYNSPPTSEALDYAILRLKLPMHVQTSSVRDAFKKACSSGENLFKNAQTTYEQKKENCSASPEERIRLEEIRLERANIIQHPLLKKDNQYYPQPKQIAFRDNKIHSHDLLSLHYESWTQIGSSGSPVVDDLGRLIGVHASDCILIEQKLFKYLFELCTHLGYSYKKDKSDSEAHCFEKEKNKLVYVFHSGEFASQCCDNRDGIGKFTLKDFICQNNEKIKNGEISLRDFITQFFLLQQKTVNKRHTYCNLAINIKAIFRDLDQNPDKLTRLKKAQTAIKIEIYPQSEKPYSDSEKPYSDIVQLVTRFVYNFFSKLASYFTPFIRQYPLKDQLMMGCFASLILYGVYKKSTLHAYFFRT